MTVDNPLVSIILPTYNRAHLIGDTIKSVFAQTYSEWELIIIDDGSEDDTESVIKKIPNQKISYYKINHSGILGKVRNYGLKLARGEYIAFLDSDDLWREDKLAFQISLFQENPYADFVFSNGSQFGDGAVIPPDHESKVVGNFFQSMVFHGRFCVLMPSLIFKSCILEKITLINETWKSGGDIDFFYRITYNFCGIFTNQRLVLIRKHNQHTSDKLGDLTYFELVEMYYSFHSYGWITKQQCHYLASKIYYKLGFIQLKRHEPKKAMENFLRHVKLSPWSWKGWVRLAQSQTKSIFYFPY